MAGVTVVEAPEASSVSGNVSLITYGVAAAAYLLLAALLASHWHRRPQGPVLLVAALLSTVWAGTVALGTTFAYPPITLLQYAELARALAWLVVVLMLLGIQEDRVPWRWLGVRWPWPLGALALVAAIVLLLRPLRPYLPAWAPDPADLALAVYLATAIAGLLTVEQLYRNASTEERWAIKFLCLGLGAVSAFDFFMYAEALLFRQLNPMLWQARGLVNALVVPWLAVAIARNRKWRIDLHVSRHVVFHTVTLFGTGIYLLSMALIGYFIKYLGGSWGGVLQIGFLAGAAALLVTLLFSGTLRARLRVFLSKHFFSYRYDYRVEWLRFTAGLAALDDVPQGIIRSMATISLSPGGLLLHRDGSGQLDSLAHWELDPPPVAGLGNVAEWVLRSGWVIDLREWHESPDIYAGLEMPAWLREHESLWLVVPLLFKDELEGLLFLARTDLKTGVNWEDRDLLKTAGRQAAALLAQQRASRALVEARQFDAFNRLSAYVVHDLKNILAQQSLMVANARRHRDNPAFVDDMIATVENSVRRMQRLMDQMRSGARSAEQGVVPLGTLLEQVAERRAGFRPLPSLTVATQVDVCADRERLATVFGHLLQNAQEATADDGAISVLVDADDSNATVQIRDTGAGMSEAFVRERLFRPFESTKGLTGMGIGAFESREYVRQLGGDISVASAPGEGSTFSVTLPRARAVPDIDTQPQTRDPAHSEPVAGMAE